MQPTVYDSIASEYYDDFHQTCRNFDLTTVAAFARERPHIPDLGLVLEVGCGRGRCNEFLGIEPARIVQLDISREMLALNPREPALLRVHADATAVPLLDTQFNAIIGFLIDSFIGLSFLSEVCRLLAPGGLFLATTPAAEWGLSLRGTDQPYASAARFVTQAGAPHWLPSTLIPLEKLAQMLHNSGLGTVTITRCCLPLNTTPVSRDISTPARNSNVPVNQLPILYLITATKPTHP